MVPPYVLSPSSPCPAFPPPPPRPILFYPQSDNNVKLIVLERLNHVKKTQPRVMRELVMDLLRALSSPNEDVQRKTLDIAMGLVSPRNVEEVMGVLKKEIVRTQGADSKANKAYR